MIGLNITPADHVLFSLPSFIGGLNIRIPTTSADTSYSASRNAKRFVIDAIKGLCDFSPNDHEVCVMVARTEYTKAQQALYDCGISGIQSRAPSGWSDSIDHWPFYMIDCSKGSTTMLYGCKNAQLSSCNQTWFYKYHPNINSAKLSDHPMAKERERKIGCSLDTQSIELNRKNVQNVTIYIYMHVYIDLNYNNNQ